ncbi:MAG: hypothetical protein ACYCQI_02340, partial [Gammaproteobacteria bacterium]
MFFRRWCYAKPTKAEDEVKTESKSSVRISDFCSIEEWNIKDLPLSKSWVPMNDDQTLFVNRDGWDFYKDGYNFFLDLTGSNSIGRWRERFDEVSLVKIGDDQIAYVHGQDCLSISKMHSRYLTNPLKMQKMIANGKLMDIPNNPYEDQSIYFSSPFHFYRNTNAKLFKLDDHNILFVAMNWKIKLFRGEGQLTGLVYFFVDTKTGKRTPIQLIECKGYGENYFWDFFFDGKTKLYV